MPDTIGTVAVPEVSPSGTFPLTLEFGVATRTLPQVAIHTFLAGNAKREQRYQLGPDLLKWELDWNITEGELTTLINFWEARQGAYQPFTFNAPNPDQSTTAYTAAFENEPISWDHQTGYQVHLPIRLRQVVTGSGPIYAVSDRLERFPDATLATALTGQVQQLIPMLKIQPKESGYPAIYLSDRRCTIGGQLYLPRLLNRPVIRQQANGVPGVDSEPDAVTFVLGNADRVMRDVAFSTRLSFARVEYSWYHVGTGIVLDHWAGEVTQEGWEIDGPEFRLSCSDLLANPFRIFPNRTIDRGCQNAFNKGRCTYAADGSLNPAYPSASAASCDKGYWTDNGCDAHNMNTRYRGVPFTPQAFRSKDNSGGLFGLFRSSFVSMSQAGDTVFGQPLPFIFTAEELRVPALLIAGADQGDFYEAIGIVGQGPLGAFGAGHTLDGQPNHGPGSLGLRTELGADPAGASAYLSLSYVGNQVNGDPQKVYDGSGSTFLRQFAAGVAFVEIKRTDEKGLQFTRLADHAMEAVVLQGLTGWIWSAGGVRSSAVLSNPIWVAANLLLWGLFEEQNSSAEQLGRIHLDSTVAAAGICDTVAAKLVGSGSETQFVYSGRIADRRPLRDQISDVLGNCLGYYYWVFGKLAFGTRENSGAVAAFTEGNMILDSLKVTAPGLAFNRLTANFADRVTDGVTGQVQMLPNTATYQDEDDALELGDGQVAYLQSETNLSGTNHISQAVRIVTTRGREEVGGVTAAQRLAHSAIEFQSTIMAIDVAPGDVVSVTSDEVPGGSVEMRVGSIEYQADFSVIIRGRTVNDDIYDLVAGPKPADVLPDSVPPEGYPLPGRTVWHPNTVTPPAGDPVYGTGDNSFIMAQRYRAKADGSKQALLDITGVMPVNRFIENALSPTIREFGSSAGGSLEASESYFVAVCARDTDGLHTPPSNIVQVTTGAGEGTIDLSSVEWPGHPSGGTYEGYTLFAAKTAEAMCAQVYFTGALPAAISWSDALKWSTWGMPNRTPRRVVAKAKLGIHLGILGEQVTAIDEVAAYSVRIAAMAGFTEDVVGRVLAVIADKSDGSADWLNFTVTAQNTATGELSLDRDPATAGVQVEDLAVIRLQAEIASANTIGDPLLVNTIYPSGLDSAADPDREKGYVIRILAGAGRGQWRKVLSYTDNTYTLETPWDTVPDSTSLWIVEAAEWQYRIESAEIANAYADTEVTVSLPVDNLLMQPVVIGLFVQDRTGLETAEDQISVRDTYLWGSLGNSVAAADGYFTAPIVSNEVTIDLANGLNQRILLDQATRVTIKNPIFTGGDIIAGSWLALYIDTDATADRPSPAFESAYGASVQAIQTSNLANKRNALMLTFDGTKWTVDSFHPEQALD